MKLSDEIESTLLYGVVEFRASIKREVAQECYDIAVAIDSKCAETIKNKFNL